MDKSVLALIVPCFNEEEILNTTFEKLSLKLNQLIEKSLISNKSFICFVDDGSQDKSWEMINKYSKNYNVKGIKFSHNFGHQKAILAGLKESIADIYITLDADLQDDINLIEEMILKYNEGCEIVYAVRNDRKSDTFFKRFTAEGFYKLCSLLGMNMIPNHADYRLVSNKIVNILRKSEETNVFLRGMIPSYGFKSAILYYKRTQRIGGTCKYNYFKSFNLAIDGITSFSDVPLKIISLIGIFITTLSLIIFLIILSIKIFVGTIDKIALLITSVCLIGGIQILCIGVVAEYIGKIFKQTKKNPLYIIEENI